MARFTRFAEGFFSNIALRGGAEWMVNCPFHGGSDSLQFNVNTGSWYCFGCHKGGSIDRLTDQTVPDYTPTMAQLRHTLNRLMNDDGPMVLPKEWLAQFDIPHDYWTEVRGLKEGTVRAWKLGYDIDSDAVTIPLRTYDGRAIHGVIKRLLDPDANIRYRYPKGFERKSYLFGEYLVPLESKALFVTEGSLDAIEAWECGVDAVAVLGSSLTRPQRERLLKLCPQRIVLAFDNDAAGEHATEAALESLRGFNVSVLEWPNNVKDFGELSIEDRTDLIEENLTT